MRILLAVLCCAACRADAPQLPDARQARPKPATQLHDAGREPTRTLASAQTLHVERPKKRARRKAQEGEVTGFEAGALADEVAENKVYSLRAQSSLTLDFAAGARVSIVGPAVFAVSYEAHAGSRDGLLLRVGTVSVDLPPAAAAPERGFWLATPNVSLQLSRAGRCAVRALANGETWLQVVSGSVMLTSGVVAAALGGSEKQLLAGDSVRVRASGVVETLGTAEPTLEAAAQGLAHARARGPKVDVAAATLTDAIAQHHTRVQAAEQRVAALRARHRAALGAPSAERQSLQAGLAREAALLARLLATERVLALQRRAAALVAPAAERVHPTPSMPQVTRSPAP